MEPVDTKSVSIVKSAQRVMEILELFDQTQRPMSLTDITTHLGYPAASASALLKSLQALDYVSFDPIEKTYSPTIRVALLGGWIQGQIFQEGAVVALMTDLQEQTGETIMLGMQNDVYAQYVHTVQSRAALRYFLKPGSLRPICRSATGYALLSAQPDSKVKRLVHKINSRRERGEVPVDEKSLLEKINDVRRLGYAYNDQLTEGISAIAMLLPTPPHGRQMALGLGGPTTRIQPKTEEIVDLMRRLIAQHLTSSAEESPS